MTEETKLAEDASEITIFQIPADNEDNLPAGFYFILASPQEVQEAENQETEVQLFGPYESADEAASAAHETIATILTMVAGQVAETADEFFNLINAKVA